MCSPPAGALGGASARVLTPAAVLGDEIMRDDVHEVHRPTLDPMDQPVSVVETRVVVILVGLEHIVGRIDDVEGGKAASGTHEQFPVEEFATELIVGQCVPFVDGPPVAALLAPSVTVKSRLRVIIPPTLRCLGSWQARVVELPWRCSPAA